MKSTPGPWKVVYSSVIVNSSNEQIAQSLNYYDQGKRVANARLIAAAPSLLSVLKELVAIQDTEEHDSAEHQLSNPHDVSDCVLCQARQVINQAEGK